MTLQPIPRSLSHAGFLTELEPAARRNVFMAPDHLEDMLAHAAARFSLQLQKQDRVSISANAMRDMLDELMTGDVSVIDDTPVMRMPDGFMTREYGEWVEIVPALDGWVDCMQRIVPDLSSGAIVDLAGLLRASEDITPELVMVARIQLEDQIQAMKRMPIGAINAAVESTKSDWRKEEKLKEEMTMNVRDKAPALPAIDGTINAAHGLLMAATDALSADQVAAMLKITKKAATVQLKELQGLGLLENEPRKGGAMYFRLAVVAEAEVCESVQTGGESQAVAHAERVMTHEAGGDAIDWTAPELQYLAPEDYEMPPADSALLSSANRMLSDRLEGVAHALRGCGLPALAEISGAEDLQMATAALSGAYQMNRGELAAAEAGQIMLSDVIANIRKAIGDDDGQIRLRDLAGHITCRMLERDVNTRTVVDALVAVADYMPDGHNYRLIDGIRTMELLIEVQHYQLVEQSRKVINLTASVTNTAELHKQITSLTTDVTNTRRALNDALNEADRMRTELAIERQARQALQEQINAAPAVAPLSYKVECSGLIYIKNASDRAIKEAERLAKLHGCPATITANVPFGTVRVVKGVEFKAAKAA